MGPTISNNANINTQITNDMLQNTNQICVSSCDANASGNSVIIGGTVDSVNITAECKASASCAMTNSSDAAVKNIIQNIINQEITAVTDFMGGIGQDLTNNININTSISNYITQITTQTCGAISNPQANDNFIWVQSGGVSGPLNISAKGDASATCAMNNISKIQAYNNSQNTVTQSATSIGMFSMIFIAIIIIVLVGGVIFVMMFAKGSFGQSVSGDPLVNGQFDPATVNRLLNQKSGLPKSGVARSLKRVV